MQQKHLIHFVEKSLLPEDNGKLVVLVGRLKFSGVREHSTGIQSALMVLKISRNAVDVGYGNESDDQNCD